ncbi:MAG: DUF368 domain-containing protein [Pirellulaceae bacterium]
MGRNVAILKRKEAFNTDGEALEQQRRSRLFDLGNMIRGFCMGAADTVPGISGGTVALILGHYERLVTAISHIDRTLIGFLRQRRWTMAAERCDLRFLVGLGFGVVAGIGSLASLMHWLLDHRMPETLAVFFGLVLASAVVVAKRMTGWNAKLLVSLVLAALGAYWLSGLSGTPAEPGKTYVFFSATVAICAMILPGISGAFILLLLGVYHPITGLVKDFMKGDWSVDGSLTLMIFAAGCLIGLAAFSRLLRWLLQVYPDITYAALTGLMLGCLRRLWPLQEATSETANLAFSHRQWIMRSPAEWSSPIWPLVALAVTAFLVVLLAEYWGQRVPRVESAKKTR